MGIPIRVEDNDGVGTLQVKAQSARARRQQEDEVLRVGVVKLLQEVAAIFGFRHTVQSV